MAVSDKPSMFFRLVATASRMIIAVTRLLEDIASLLRQLVHIAGWVVLLIGAINLVIHPHLSLEHLAVPGAGALAVLQSLVKPWPRRSEQTAASTEETLQLDADQTTEV